MRVRSSESSFVATRSSSNSSYLIVVLATLLSTIPPLSSDLYLPGLPLLTTDLSSEPAIASQTLTVFFLFMAIGTLVSGTISDKTGRRPMLLFCSFVTTVACIGCALASSITMLLIFRAIQGIAGGGLVTGGMVIVKDSFEGDRMAKMLALTQAVAMIAPVAAPLVGVMVLSLGSWRSSFVVVALLMAVCFILVLRMKETLPREPHKLEVCKDPIHEVVIFLRQGRFMLPLMVAALFNSIFMSYIGNASYIYEDYFGLSATLFGVVFAITSLFAIAGPLAYMRMEKGLNVPRVVSISIVVMGILCVPLLIFGTSGPLPFMACMIVVTFSTAYVRPMVASFLLEPLTTSVGAASSIINFVTMAFGCAGMLIGTLGFSFIEGIQSVALISFVLMILFWAIYSLRYGTSK